MNTMNSPYQTDEIDLRSYYQGQSASTTQLPAIQEILLNQKEQLVLQQQQIGALAREFHEIALILQHQQKNDSGTAIDTIKQNMSDLGKATIATYQKLDKTQMGKELSDLKAEQQALRKIADTAQRTLKIQSDNLATHLDWKRTAAIMVSTAVLSSLCSVAIVQLIPNGWSHSANPTKPISKKPVKSRN
jgi:hypothetical protein